MADRFRAEAEAAWDFVSELVEEGEYYLADRLAIILSAAKVKAGDVDADASR